MIWMFFLVLLFSLFLLNFSVYYPLATAYDLSGKARRKFILILGLATLLMIGGEAVRRIWGIYWLSITGFIIMGIYSITFSVMMINMLVYLFAKSFRKILPFSPKTILRTGTTVSLVLSVILSLTALINNYRIPAVKHYRLVSSKINDNTAGFRILFVSDFHITGATNADRLERVMQRINETEPDIIIIGGDLVDEPWSEIKNSPEYFGKLSSTYGTYVVSGNHDFYSKKSSFLQFAAEARMTILNNENVRIKDGITLIGIPDPTAKIMGYEEPDPIKALQGVNENDFLIFAAHQPLYYEQASETDLILAGHTHRGQIPPLNWLVLLYFKYPYGLYHPYPNRYIYTTSGVDTWGPPMRLFTNNEIVLFTLSK